MDEIPVPYSIHHPEISWIVFKSKVSENNYSYIIFVVARLHLSSNSTTNFILAYKFYILGLIRVLCILKQYLPFLKYFCFW